MALRKPLKLDLVHRANVEYLLGIDFITTLEEIGESIKPEIVAEEEKESHTPPSTDDSVHGSTSSFATTLSEGVHLKVHRRDKSPLTSKNATTITQAFNNVIQNLEKLPLPSERKIEDDSSLFTLIESIKANTKSLTQAAKLSDNENRGYTLIQGLIWLAQEIMRLAFTLCGAFLGYAVNSAIPGMGVPAAVTGGVAGYRAAEKALSAFNNYAGINLFNRRPYQAEKTKKLEEILEKKISTPGSNSPL